jgi:hypothetical protein
MTWPLLPSMGRPCFSCWFPGDRRKALTARASWSKNSSRLALNKQALLVRSKMYLLGQFCQVQKPVRAFLQQASQDEPLHFKPRIAELRGFGLLSLGWRLSVHFDRDAEGCRRVSLQHIRSRVMLEMTRTPHRRLRQERYNQRNSRRALSWRTPDDSSDATRPKL